jgi:hypothetical protein
VAGHDGIKPGWIRLNLNYFLSDTVADYLIEAVNIVASDGWRFLPEYDFDLRTGSWRHRAAPDDLAPSLWTLPFLDAPPVPHDSVPESHLADHLAQARALIAERQDVTLESSSWAAEDPLCWFDVPEQCVTGPGAR